MSAKNKYSDHPTLFEATISIDLEERHRLEPLDIDVLPEPKRSKTTDSRSAHLCGSTRSRLS